MPVPALPPAQVLALAGIGFVAAFALWKGFAARRANPAEGSSASS